ncbi:16S rRNA (guanine966-N2)-methyltransferase [Arboricoccus pini]|uniref:16S rRNA (Guanine966-N2)-methyltransferase n=1 Tax=Arboricoccus pini TaxID=1963835 RepID=A0A212QUA0_9PROT|nr:16S rRNA (guanine(966)-N(2))-methyltransferase RsmD [Arboricoccus pini]SNB63194.1 16S rRNA (guanine966-N2)-methyltransferase [Arboricoccus pini]
MRIIAGTARGRRLEAPRDTLVRPTSDRAREALFGILAHGTPSLDGARFLDLFAGTGAVGLEAWSRGAAAVTLVEQDRAAIDVIQTNIRVLGAASVDLLRRDATRLGRASGDPFDIVFMDPPYHSDLAARALTGLIGSDWLAPSARVIVELAARETLVLSPEWALLDERRYGAARFLFIAAARQGT